MEKLLKHLDDSSDEEDSFSDYDPKVIEDFQNLYANIKSEISEIGFILESEGRRVIYEKATVKRYQDKKNLLRTDAPTESEKKRFSSAVDVKKGIEKTQDLMTSKNLLRMIEVSLQQFLPLYQISPSLQKEALDTFEKMSQEERTRLFLKQSNSEFLLDQIKEVLQSPLEDIVNQRVNLRNLFPQDLLSSDDFFKIEDLKNEAISITTAVEVAEVQKEYQKLQIDNPTQIVQIKDWEEKALKAARNKTHQKSVASKQLAEEIGKYLKGNLFNNGYQLSKETILYQLIKKAKESGYNSILQKINPTESKKDIFVSKTKTEIFSTMGVFLSNNLKSNFPFKFPRKILPTLYSNHQEIKNIHDFFAEQLLFQRSLTRMSRNTVERENKEKNLNFVYDSQSDVVSQRSSTVYGRKAAFDPNFIMHQGTKLEIITNLGTYGSKVTIENNRVHDLFSDIVEIKGKAVLEELKKLRVDDHYIPHILRSLFQYGFSAEISNEGVGPNIDEVLTEERRNTFMRIIDLLFGLEGLRSPSAIVETNMAFDLVENKILTLKEIFSENLGLGGGGALSYTMKSAQGAGGVECGRRLSNDVNYYISRKHKYGGEMIKLDSKGYSEFLQRKAALVQKWRELQKKDLKQKDLNLKEMIRNQDEKWYGIKLSD